MGISQKASKFDTTMGFKTVEKNNEAKDYKECVLRKKNLTLLTGIKNTCMHLRATTEDCVISQTRIQKER